MAKSSNQKLKILYLVKIFYEKTDLYHGITMSEITEALSGYGVSAERKSIYDDLESLRTFGIGIDVVKENGKSYYSLEKRVFELPELKLIIDAVQSSKFITEKKSNELIKKIECFSSKYESTMLQRQVFVADRVKTMNENIYYNVDEIHNAINENKKISFIYYEWNIEKKMVPKKNGERYIVSPWALSWDDENYYLIAYDSKDKTEKHFRVDKMKDIVIISEKREGSDVFRAFNAARYSKRLFGMYGGKDYKVTLRVKNNKIGIIIDRFGNDIPVFKEDNKFFTTKVDVKLSKQFIGWIISLGEDVKVLAPEIVINNIKEEVGRLLKEYGE